MKPNSATHVGNSILAVLGGAFSTFLAGLLLYPVLLLLPSKLITVHLFENNPRYGAGDTIFIILILVWFFIAAMAGGYITAAIARTKPFLHTGILALVTVLIIAINMISADTPLSHYGQPAVIALIFTSGYILGAFVAKNRRARQQNQQEPEEIK